MRLAGHALLFGGLAVTLTGCLGLSARTPSPALKTPESPSRLVMPAPDPVPADPAATAPGATGPVGAGRSTPPPVTTRPPDRVTPPPVVPPPDPPPVLQTTSNVVELEKRIQTLLDAARRDLDKVNPNVLPSQVRAQYDWAQLLARQADAALKSKNYNYADQLADKAARLASLLAKG